MSTPQSITSVLPASSGSSATSRMRSQSETAITRLARFVARRVSALASRLRSTLPTSVPCAVSTSGAPTARAARGPRPARRRSGSGVDDVGLEPLRRAPGVAGQAQVLRPAEPRAGRSPPPRARALRLELAATCATNEPKSGSASLGHIWLTTRIFTGGSLCGPAPIAGGDSNSRPHDYESCALTS